MTFSGLFEDFEDLLRTLRIFSGPFKDLVMPS